MDKMTLNGMRFFGYHGVFPEENRLGQNFHVDLVLKLDLEQASRTDELEHSINYADLHAATKKIVEGPPVKLIEALAGRIATALLETYTGITELTVRVTKPNPPFEIHFDGVVVELVRKRDEHGEIVPA
ncbi:MULTISPECIES: dihydroneopterin aldolase [unclassified Paenibacillus]|uniref:dihydroneopterin aldolase n=1 Tax=unclassified Paenibacillus TaxID=185978 RepID=UPI0009551F4C|nr:MULTISPECIES: dihydroneopterin aldolase [unclassified Paenibacillus]ASS67729.1 dihydroneopterin aldolase [Paenibacillus sp. RUD330]SIR67586.1 dihydroneopterin aldolase [Paenibacillus sp. RU4X]SIR75348.1 dihydroneopterin aldolase [Paenibacillus sp. RU4T]